MDQLIANGRVVRGWLGVSIQPIGSKEARAPDLDQARGALVGDVTPDSPVSRAGLERGDVIEEVYRKSVSNVPAFSAALRDLGSKPVLRLVNRSGTTAFVAVEPR